MERLTEKFKDGRNILRKGIFDIFYVGFGRFFEEEAEIALLNLIRTAE